MLPTGDWWTTYRGRCSFCGKAVERKTPRGGLPTSRTLYGGGPAPRGLRQRQGDFYRRTVALPGADGQGPAEALGPFFHSKQSEPGLVRGLEATSVVAHGHRKSVTVNPEADFGRTGAGVFADVIQRLLHDPED